MIENRVATRPIRAWRCSWLLMPGVHAYAAAETRGQALNILRGSIVDAGWQPEWQDLRALRAPDLDGWAAGLAAPERWRTWSPEAVESVTKPKERDQCVNATN